MPQYDLIKIFRVDWRNEQLLASVVQSLGKYGADLRLAIRFISEGKGQGNHLLIAFESTDKVKQALILAKDRVQESLEQFPEIRKYEGYDFSGLYFKNNSVEIFSNQLIDDFLVSIIDKTPSINEIVIAYHISAKKNDMDAFIKLCGFLYNQQNVQLRNTFFALVEESYCLQRFDGESKPIELQIEIARDELEAILAKNKPGLDKMNKAIEGLLNVEYSIEGLITLLGLKVEVDNKQLELNVYHIYYLTTQMNISIGVKYFCAFSALKIAEIRNS